MFERLSNTHTHKKRGKVAAGLLAITLSLASCSHQKPDKEASLRPPSMTTAPTTSTTMDQPKTVTPEVERTQIFNPSPSGFALGINCKKPIRDLHQRPDGTLVFAGEHWTRHLKTTVLGDSKKTYGIFVGAQTDLLDGYLGYYDGGFSVVPKDSNDGFIVYQSYDKTPAFVQGTSYIGLMPIDEFDAAEAQKPHEYSLDTSAGRLAMRLLYSEQLTEAIPKGSHFKPNTGPGLIVNLECIPPAKSTPPQA